VQDLQNRMLNYWYRLCRRRKVDNYLLYYKTVFRSSRKWRWEL